MEQGRLVPFLIDEVFDKLCAYSWVDGLQEIRDSLSG